MLVPLLLEGRGVEEQKTPLWRALFPLGNPLNGQGATKQGLLSTFSSDPYKT